MKKLLTVTLLALVAMFCLALFGACSDHEHDWSDWTYVEGQVADCTHEGEEKRVCNDCGEEETRKAAALGHDFGEYSQSENKHTRVCRREGCGFTEAGDCTYVTALVAPDCRNGGYTAHTCSVCGMGYNDNPTAPVDHSFTHWNYSGTDSNGRRTHTASCDFGCGTTCSENCEHDSATVPPECEKAGYTSHTCSKCGDSYRDAETLPLQHSYGQLEHIEKNGKHYHTRTCFLCQKSEALQECNLTPKTFDPTCDSAGYTEYTCETCGYTYRGNEKKKLEHNWGNWQFSGERGVHYRSCVRQNCTVTETASCEYDSYITHPTCDEQGYTTYVCKDCKNSYRDHYTDMKGHEWGGYEHNPDTHTHFRHCLANPDHKSASEDCVFTQETFDPTCEEDGKIVYTCRYCGFEYEEKNGDALDHAFSPWTYAGVNEAGKDYHKRSCYICGKEETGECNLISSSDADVCTSPEPPVDVCEKCLHKDEEAGVNPELGHDYGEWQYAQRDNGVRYHYRTCDNDGSHREEGDCRFVKTSKDPTCDERGIITYTCAICGYEYTEEFGEATGHIWGDWLIDADHATHSHKCNVCGEIATDNCQFRVLSVTDPTCDERGYTTYICDECGDTYNGNYVNETGHAWNSPKYAGIIGGKHMHVRVCSHDNTHTQYEECSDGDPTVTAPTCNRDGYTTYVCDTCGESYTANPTSATGIHNWGDWEKASNPFVNPDNFYCHRHRCTNPGCDASEIFSCDLYTVSKQATCLEAGYSYMQCTECQRKTESIEIPALGHDFSDGYTHIEEDGADMHTRTCNRAECGFIEKEPCNMVTSEKAPTCNYSGTRTEICDKCLYSESVELEKLTHSWETWKLYAPGKHYRICSACGTRENAACNYDLQSFEGNCTQQGYTVRTCRECKDTSVISVNEGYGHKWIDITISEGTHSAKCSECGKQVNEAHDYSLSNFCSVCKNDGLAYILDETNTYYIVWHDRDVRSAKTIEIPEYHLGKPVREISIKFYNSQTGGFNCNSNVQEVILPQNLKVIEGGAFSYCTSLRSVRIRNEDGDDFSPSLVTIGASAFRGCSYLVSAGNLPDTLVTIGDNAFLDCTRLSDIVLPETIQSIGAHAFDGTAYYKDKTHWSGNALYIGKHLIKVENTVTGKFDIRPDTLTIGIEAFKDCVSMTGVTIPASVNYIDADAFLGCTGLTSAEYKGDFGGWMKINFVNDYSSPLKYASELHIDQAHNDITIPDGVTEIPANTFRGTEIETIHIPASVTTIGENAFAECLKLKNVTLASGSALSVIRKDAFKGSLFYNSDENWNGDILYLKDDAGKTIAVIGVKETATGVIEIPDGTRIIADYAFSGVTGITKVTTPDWFSAIGAYAFKDCTGLEEVTIGYYARRIGEKAFEGCSALTKANFENINGWLYRPVHYAIYRTVPEGILDDPSKAADYLKNPEIFELNKIF